MRLIDADALIAELHGTYLYDDNARQVIYRKIETQPTIEECKEDKYKIGYADGYHKAESEYYARTATDRDNAFKMGIEVGRGERKTGRWIDGSIPTYAACSECGYQERYAYENNYCPNCGADMKGEQDEINNCYQKN